MPRAECTRSHAANQLLAASATIDRRFWEEFPFRDIREKKGPDRFDPGRTALRDGYLSVIAFDFDPPSTGELEKTVTEVGLLVQTVVSVGSDGPPGLNTWS